MITRNPEPVNDILGLERTLSQIKYLLIILLFLIICIFGYIINILVK